MALPTRPASMVAARHRPQFADHRELTIPPRVVPAELVELSYDCTARTMPMNIPVIATPERSERRRHTWPAGVFEVPDGRAHHPAQGLPGKQTEIAQENEARGGQVAERPRSWCQLSLAVAMRVLRQGSGARGE